MLKKVWLIALLIVLIPAFLASMQSNEDDDDPDTTNYNGENSAVETVVEFMGKFETLSASTADVGSFMGVMSFGVFALLKLGFPVGSLVAGSLHIATKTESDEYKALMRLHKKMDSNFDKLQNTIEVSFRIIALSTKLHDFQNKVHVPLKALRRDVKLFWDPSIEKTTEAVERFKQTCYYNVHGGTPLNMLDYIQVHTVESCSGFAPEQISLASEFIQPLNKLRFKITNESERERFDPFAAELTIVFSQFDSYQAKTVLQKMEQSIGTLSTISSSQSAFRMVQSLFLEAGVDELQLQPSFGCLLQDVIMGKNFHRHEIEEVMNAIRLDVLEILVFGSICANITMDGNPRRMEWFKHELGKSAQAILDFVGPFVSTELLKSFPKIEMGIVKSKIDEMQLQEPVTDNSTIFQATAKVFKTLDEYGSSRYVRQGFISTNLQNDTNTLIRCNISNCFFLFDVHSLNIMVTQFDVANDEVRASKAWDWLFSHGVYESVATLLWRHINVDYNINSIAQLVANFENGEHEKLTSNDHYGNMAVLRDFGGTGQCGVTSTPSFLRISDEFAASAFVTYYFAGSIWHACESFVFLFFV